MRGDVDPRLVEFLKGSLGLTDALRLIGIKDGATVSFDREDGLRLLELVAGTSDEDAEEWSQRGRATRSGRNSLKVAGLVYEWPRVAVRTRAAANDNDGSLHGVEWFEGDIPALG
jgi:hypothetical protein